MPSKKTFEMAPRRRVAEKMKVVTNGEIVDRLKTPNLYNVKKAERILSQRSLVHIPPNPVDPLSVQSLSKYVLSGLGCTYSGEKVDFSLLATQTDTETIANPYIIDEVEWSYVANEPIVAVDKFVNVAQDPFYKLDDDLPHEVQNEIDAQEEEDIPDASYVVSDLVLYNSNAIMGKLKQFI
tara:strand:+ start:2333 stop:2875 length:543 start_codon:yes stop_codon:yes gene_type:complete